MPGTILAVLHKLSHLIKSHKPRDIGAIYFVGKEMRAQSD